MFTFAPSSGNVGELEKSIMKLKNLIQNNIYDDKNRKSTILEVVREYKLTKRDYEVAFLDNPKQIAKLDTYIWSPLLDKHNQSYISYLQQF